jgi:hypothetical protein
MRRQQPSAAGPRFGQSALLISHHFIDPFCDSESRSAAQQMV